MFNNNNNNNNNNYTKSKDGLMVSNKGISKKPPPSSTAEVLKSLVGFDFLHNSPLACSVLYSSSLASDRHHHIVQPPCT
jgi:hypothetical protein